MFKSKKDNFINIFDFSKYIKKTETRDIWTDAFREALKCGKYLFIPKGKYYIDDTVILPSNITIQADKKAEICLVKGTKVVGFRNADVIDGSKRKVDFDEPMSENIVINGGIWATEYDARAAYGKICAFDDEDSMHGVHAFMLFSGVRNLHLSNLTFKSTPAFALQLGRLDNFIVEKIKFDSCYADGVHINGFVKNGVVTNVEGEVGDDLVALNAYDWPNSTINQGPIENVRITNIKSKGKGVHWMRFLPGVTSEAEGKIDCYIKDIFVSNIKGVTTYKLYLQTPIYKEKPEGATVGWMKNITIQKLKIVKDRPSDETSNYQAADPLTGRFGVFELGSNIDGLILKDIKVKFKCESKYAKNVKLIMVGPKSSRIEDKGIEIFDPYVKSTVKNLAYKNITVNGKKVKNLKNHIEEIIFDKIYDSEYATGYGKVENIIKM